MIRYVSGNLLKDDAQVLVNPVNCVGAMGKGLALAFKQAFPAIDGPYRRACSARELVPGRVQFIDIEGGARHVANFPTKDHWRNPSQLGWIQEGLCDLVYGVSYRDCVSVAIPALGCGLGGLPWEQVKAAIETTFADHPAIEARVYAPR